VFCGGFCIKWGTSNKLVRFKCNACFKTFTLRKINSKHKYFDLFKLWISKGVTVDTLNNTNISNKSLIKHFHGFLDNPPKLPKLKIPREINLKCDGKYFGRTGCSLVFKENKNIIFWTFVARETYLNYLMAFSQLNAAGYIIKSVTSDKHGSILGAVKIAFPAIPHQYCMVHIQRRCETLLTQKPETQVGKDLLELVRCVNKIKTLNDKQIFVKWLLRFEKRYELTLKQRTYDNKTWWYTHKNLRLAFNTLKSSQNNMFFYLGNSNIPKDTNGLEAEFTHLKTKLNIHRGLSKNRKENYVFWYWFLKSIYLNQH
jgi:hypothetical protein